MIRLYLLFRFPTEDVCMFTFLIANNAFEGRNFVHNLLKRLADTLALMYAMQVMRAIQINYVY